MTRAKTPDESPREQGSVENSRYSSGVTLACITRSHNSVMEINSNKCRAVVISLEEDNISDMSDEIVFLEDEKSLKKL